jgi:predicted sulfurtransferase
VQVNELVAYGLANEMAPSLNHSKAVHLEADAYHAMMSESNTVIVDVRNAYESAIGHFAPPEVRARAAQLCMPSSIERAILERRRD